MVICFHSIFLYSWFFKCLRAFNYSQQWIPNYYGCNLEAHQWHWEKLAACLQGWATYLLFILQEYIMLMHFLEYLLSVYALFLYHTCGQTLEYTIKGISIRKYFWLLFMAILLYAYSVSDSIGFIHIVSYINSLVPESGYYFWQGW